MWHFPTLYQCRVDWLRARTRATLLNVETYFAQPAFGLKCFKNFDFQLRWACQIFFYVFLMGFSLWFCREHSLDCWFKQWHLGIFLSLGLDDSSNFNQSFIMFLVKKIWQSAGNILSKTQSFAKWGSLELDLPQNMQFCANLGAL